MDGAEYRLSRKGSFDVEQQLQDALHSEMENIQGQMGQLRNVKDNVSALRQNDFTVNLWLLIFSYE